MNNWIGNDNIIPVFDIFCTSPSTIITTNLVKIIVYYDKGILDSIQYDTAKGTHNNRKNQKLSVSVYYSLGQNSDFRNTCLHFKTILLDQYSFRYHLIRCVGKQIYFFKIFLIWYFFFFFFCKLCYAFKSTIKQLVSTFLIYWEVSIISLYSFLTGLN